MKKARRFCDMQRIILNTIMFLQWGKGAWYRQRVRIMHGCFIAEVLSLHFSRGELKRTCLLAASNFWLVCLFDDVFFEGLEFYHSNDYWRWVRWRKGNASLHFGTSASLCGEDYRNEREDEAWTTHSRQLHLLHIWITDIVAKISSSVAAFCTCRCKQSRVEWYSRERWEKKGVEKLLAKVR